MSLHTSQPDTSNNEIRGDKDNKESTGRKTTLSVSDLQQAIKNEAQANQSNDAPKVGSFPIDVFPAQIRDLITQSEKYKQFRPDWLGASILYAASVAVGNSVRTEYKDWSQKTTLYIAIVGMPGTNKSGPAEFALKPLRALDSELYHTYKKLHTEYSSWQGMSKKERLAEGLPITLEPPTFKTLLVSDITPEALAQTHQANPLGIGLFMDELAGWFHNFNRYNKGSEEQFWLSNWSFSPINVVRKSSVPIKIYQPFISVLGTIQPGILSELAKDGRGQNGFIDRILFTYPDIQHKPYDVEGYVDSVSQLNYTYCINRIFSLRDQTTVISDGDIGTKVIPFSPEAHDLMKTWRKQNTDRVNGTDAQSLKGIFVKFEAYCIRFALLLELLEWGCNDGELTRIRLDSVKNAIRLTEYFTQNALKIHYVLNEQTEVERLPKSQQRLYQALPDEFETSEALKIGLQLTPQISVATTKRLLKDSRLFKRLKQGSYTKQF